MRALKTILIILGAVVGVLVILGVFAAPNFRVERTTVIHAPATAVYSNVSTLTNMDKWGPWKEMEHNMTARLSGPADGQVGAISHWKSDESEGEQELAELVPNEKVRTKLRFISPWAANNEGTFDISAMGDSTKVTWGIQGENDFIGRVVSVFMNMDKMVGPMFEKGMSNLKTLTEAEAQSAAEMAASSPAVEIMNGDRPAVSYVGIKSSAKMPWSEIPEFFMDKTPKVFEAMGKANVEPDGPLCGLYYDWNEKDMTTSMMVCVPVAEGTKVGGLSADVVPAGKAYWIVLNGGYGGMKGAHEALGAKINADNMDHAGAVLEEYVSGQANEPDSTKWITNIIYTVKPKS